MDSREFDKVFLLHIDAYTRGGEDALMSYADRDEDRRHCIIIPQSYLPRLEELARTTKDVEVQHSAEAVLRLIRSKAQEQKDQWLALADNLYVHIRPDAHSFEEIAEELREHHSGNHRSQPIIISNNDAVLTTYSTQGYQCAESRFDKLDPSIVNWGLIEPDSDELCAELISDRSIPIERVEHLLGREFFVWGETLKHKRGLYLFPNQVVRFSQGNQPVLGIVTGERVPVGKTGDVRLEQPRLDLITETEYNKMKRTPILGVEAVNDEIALARRFILDEGIRTVILVGRAGTGKTVTVYTACMEQILTRPGYKESEQRGESTRYQRMTISKPDDLVGGRDPGFLPGDILQKMAPFIKSFGDAHEFARELRIPFKQMMLHPKIALGDDYPARTMDVNIKGRHLPPHNEALTFEYIGYLRGRSLTNVILYLDETQNTHPHELRDVLTRAGPGTKTILSGDPQQVDNPHVTYRRNGLLRAIHHLTGHPTVALIRLDKNLRHISAELAANMPDY